MKRFVNDIPTKFIFGDGTLEELAKEKLPGKRALLVISNGKSTRANGYLARTQALLAQAGAQSVVFDKIQPNPLKDTVMEGAKAARDHKCDFIVALGGGSVMDASKAIAAMATNDGDLWDYVQFGTGKKQAFKNRALPLVAITTTAGTGSELDAGGVITNPQTNEKTAVFDDSFFPVISIVDPTLTHSVPPFYTACQGFDALFHSLEGYVSKNANPISDMYALNAIENVGRYLARAVKNGNDAEARAHVSFGNSLSGMMMSTGSCTSEHSLEHALSAYHQQLPHGAGLIMISLAYFTHLIKRGACPQRFVRMAKALGMEDAKEPMDFIYMLKKLQEDCGVADLKMSDYGIAADEFKKFAENAKSAMSFLVENDPVSLSIEDCVAIYANSYR